jgi:hypothetical protein
LGGETGQSVNRLPFFIFNGRSPVFCGNGMSRHPSGKGMAKRCILVYIEISMLFGSFCEDVWRRERHSGSFTLSGLLRFPEVRISTIGQQITGASLKGPRLLP